METKSLPEQARHEALREIEATLEAQGLDASDRDALMRHFADAFDQPVSADGDLDRSRRQWLETVELLRENDILSGEDCRQLTAEFDAQMSKLDNAEFARALERANGLASR